MKSSSDLLITSGKPTTYYCLPWQAENTPQKKSSTQEVFLATQTAYGKMSVSLLNNCQKPDYIYWLELREKEAKKLNLILRQHQSWSCFDTWISASHSKRVLSVMMIWTLLTCSLLISDGFEHEFWWICGLQQNPNWKMKQAILFMI